MKWAERRGWKRSGWVGGVQKLGFRSVAKALAFIKRRNWYPAMDRSNPAFQRRVAIALPAEIKSSHERMRVLRTAWEQPARAKRAPSLSIAVALEENNYRQTAAKYDLSVEVDLMHAVFAPVVAVFTCDKRNYPHVARVVTAAELPTAILRTGNLPAVINEIEKRLGRAH